MLGENVQRPVNEGVGFVVQDPDDDPNRQRWESRLVFILAAIGSAVGLGNVWRFPYLVTKYGGGTFLIPYTVCLVGIGMPILLMELALGQKFQGGDVEAFGKMNPRLRGIGMASIFSSMTIIAYYVVIIAWTVIYFFQSCYELEWTTIADASNYFNVELLEFADLAKLEGNSDGSWKILMGLILCWVAIYFCVFKGVLSAGWVVKITMPLPVLILVILMFRSVMLEGAGDGIDQYLGNWDLDYVEQKATNTIWADATGQVFFTLGVCMGVMTAYSSFNPQSQNIVVDEKFISLGDYTIAFLAGFTIYAIMGNIVHDCKGITNPAELLALTVCDTEGINSCANVIAEGRVGDVCKTLYNKSGMGLAFQVFPYGLSTLAGAKFWCAIFFLMLFTLGVDSAFSLVEASTTVVGDSQLAKRMKWSKQGISMFVCILLFLIGTLFTTDTGLGWLDIVDYYVNSFCLLLVGFFECIATGWVFRYEAQVDQVGWKSILVYNLGTMAAIVLGCAIGFGLTEPTKEGDKTISWDDGAVNKDVAWIVGTCIGLGIWGAATAVAYVLVEEPADHPDRPQSSKLWSIMGWHGCDSLRVMVNRQNHPNWEPNTIASETKAMFSHTTMPIYFGLFIKYVDPLILFLMIVDTWRTRYYEPYGGYLDSQLAVGWCIFAFAIFLGFFPVVCPVLMMGVEEARNFEGFDLAVYLASLCGHDLLSNEWLGFNTKPEQSAIDMQTMGKSTSGTAEVQATEKRKPDSNLVQ